MEGIWRASGIYKQLN